MSLLRHCFFDAWLKNLILKQNISIISSNSLKLSFILKNKCCFAVHIWRVTPGLGITWGTCSLREEPRTDPNIPQEKMIPTLSWQSPTLSLRELCGCSVHGTRNEGVGICHNRVGVIFFSGGWGSVWGSSRRLKVPYVITRPGVTRHMYIGGRLTSNLVVPLI